jgi:hypothetical protein
MRQVIERGRTLAEGLEGAYLTSTDSVSEV